MPKRKGGGVQEWIDMANGIYQTAQQIAGSQAGSAIMDWASGGQTIGSTAAAILAPEKPKPQSAANALANTKLRSYLDRRYQRKCGVEVKQWDVIDTATLGTTLAAVFYPFADIAIGQTDETRIGNSIEVKKWAFRSQFFAEATTSNPTTIRVILIKQGRMAGAAPNVADILETPTNIRSPYSLNKNAAFTVLKDFTFMLAGATTGEREEYKLWNHTYTPKHCHAITWDQADTLGSLANMIDGNVTVFMMYAGSAAPTWSFYSRAEYIDV